MVSQGCLNLTKYLLFLFNLLFFILGVLLFVIGLWITCDLAGFLSYGLSPMSLHFISYFLTIAGIITMLLGFFGCLGPLKEIKCMLFVYFFLLTLLFASEIVGGVICINQEAMVGAALEEKINELITSYGQNDSIPQDFENTLNDIQTMGRCCGWSGPSDWANKKPCSCYVNNTDCPVSSGLEPNSSQYHDHAKTGKCQEHPMNSNTTQCEVYEKGCKAIILDWIKDNVTIIWSILLTVATVELSGMILSMCLYRGISLDYDVLRRYS